MSTPPPKFDLRAWAPSRKALLIAAAAFAVGLLLFLALWLGQRGQNEFYRAERAPQDAEGQQFDPLPTPLPAGHSDGTASGMDETPEPPQAGEPRIAETTPPPQPVEQQAPPRPEPQHPPQDIVDNSVPQPIRSPAPRYPRSAQRRRESGTVLLRVHVGPDGGVDRVDLVQSSRSRDLDRAASDAVRRWRFRPAMRDGRPVAAAVQVPITFNTGR